MKSLTTLIKLQKTRVDEQRVHLAKQQENLEQIELKVAALEIEKAREQVAAGASSEARATYGAFLKGSVQRARELEKARLAAIAAIDISRAHLAELFEEQKRYEIAEAARNEKEAQRERRRERLALDEVGTVAFSRKKTE